MTHGLSKSTVDKICVVLRRFPAVEKAVLYGSRAKGTFTPGSDIDLTLLGEGLTYEHLRELTAALDDLMLPYMIDLSLYAELNHEKLQEHIDRVGVEFYRREQDPRP